MNTACDAQKTPSNEIFPLLGDLFGAVYEALVALSTITREPSPASAALSQTTFTRFRKRAVQIRWRVTLAAGFLYCLRQFSHRLFALAKLRRGDSWGWLE